MSPDLLDELRDADPARRGPAAPDPDWGAIQARITATPRPRRRRAGRVVAPALAGAVALGAIGAIAVIALRPAEPDVGVQRPAAPMGSPIYHFIGVSQELEGPDRTPVPGTRGRREGWLDPATGELREVTPSAERIVHADGSFEYGPGSDPQAPPVPAANPDAGGARLPEPDGTVLGTLRRGDDRTPLEDRGTTTYAGRRVRELVFENADRTFRTTYLVDAETELPVLIRTETGDHLRTGAPTPAGQRVIEERFEVFERLPDGSDRSLLTG